MVCGAPSAITFAVANTVGYGNSLAGELGFGALKVAEQPWKTTGMTFRAIQMVIALDRLQLVWHRSTRFTGSLYNPCSKSLDHFWPEARASGMPGFRP